MSEEKKRKFDQIKDRFGDNYGVKKSLEDIVSVIFGVKNSRELISKKQVKVDGQVINKSSASYLGIPKRILSITINDEEISAPIIPTILLMNKPYDCETTVGSTKNKTVIDYLHESKIFNPILHKKVVPIGRLDLNTTGILLFTNDGLLMNCMLTKESHLPKTYSCFLEKDPSDEDIEVFSKGITIPLRGSKSRDCQPCKAKIVSPKVVELTLCEGAHHQVKRMWIERGNKVEKLERISFGPIHLDENLKYGQVRELTPKEQIEIYKSVFMEESFFCKSIDI